MKPLSLSRIAQWTSGRLIGEDAQITRVATDTRKLQPVNKGAAGAALFVALIGERFDGHDHLAQAAANGARAALVSRHIDDAGLPQIVVADTEQALAAIARGLQRERAGKVIAITGSNGKTSVKALLLSILQHAAQRDGRVVYANPGNLNNEIGLPLAVIGAPEDAAVAVYEMGAGKPGDIRYLTGIVRPDAALVNNIAPAHLERMGSLLGVADTKAAIYDALPADGIAAINADDAFAPYFAERAHGRRLLRFGLEASADISARDIHGDAQGSRFVLTTPAGNAPVALALPGRHNVRNALAAAALAFGMDVPLQDIAAGLDAARSVGGRLVLHRLPSGAVLIDDSYNANPGSLAAAIEILAASRDNAWLVLGDMRELGADTIALHAQAGHQARTAGIGQLYALGELSAHAVTAFGEGGQHFATHEALIEALRPQLRNGVTVLVKGSRGSAMDRIVSALLEGSQP